MENTAETKALPKNNDRIAEAYNGNIDARTTEVSRNRINWICSQAKGENILDVGCSQGTVSIILAREGKTVTGIDINQESINYANESLAAEDETSRRYAAFLCTDFVSYVKENSQKYDSIVMGEILEHLADPQRFIEYAFDYLAENGVLVVTVPFGINDYHDHKRTYYLTEIYNTIAAKLTITDIKFLGSWMGMVCEKAAGESILLDEILFAKTEIAFMQHERSIIDRLNKLSNQWKETANDNAKMLTAWKTKAEENLKSKESWKAKAEENLKSKESWKTKAEENLKSKESWKTKAEENLKSKESWKTKAEENLKSKESWKAKAEENLKSKNSWKAKAEENLEKLKQAQKYIDDLSNSKLGRIQVSVWRRRAIKKLKKNAKIPLKEQLKQTAKQSPMLVSAVRKIRRQESPPHPAKLHDTKISVEVAEQITKRFNDFMQEIELQLKTMPTSTKGRFYRKAEQKIAIISDEFLYNTYKDIAETTPLHPQHWQNQVDNINMLLIISSWRGIKEEWSGLSQTGSKKRSLVLEIISHCKGLNLPTVFYSKEDPPNYQQFIEIAQHCDYVFTAAAEVVDDYKRDCGHNRVFSLMFGINPLFHNPVGSQHGNKRNEVIFSGSWLDKYPERGIDICNIFDGVLGSNRQLKVFDRNFALKDQRYSFPNKYAQYISPGVPHETLQKVHKLYDWAINMNSVKASQTMFANRVYELEATGNLMISNYSVGINSHLPLIYTMQDSDEVTQILDTLSPTEIIERQAAGIRHAMTGNTCFDRYAEICEHVGFPVVSQQRFVCVAVDEITPEITVQFENQSYLDKELCLISDLPQRYEEFDMIAFWGVDKHYDIFYLEDMINAFKYTDCDYITKNESRQHDFVGEINNKYCTVFWRESFEVGQLLEMPKDGTVLPNGYSVDSLHFAEKPATEPKPSNRLYKLSVVIPVYNNGLHLYGKAFASLLRSSIFADMEILLIDDGSTDSTTKLYVKYIADRYENVRTFAFADGGSGSASRPRNKGVEMATAEYITFLDPDNEAIGDGYAKLYNLAIAESHDLTVGNMIRYRENSQLANYYHYFKNVYGNDLVTSDKREFISKISFTPMSIQAMVVEKRLITENNLTQVIGAIGQDSFFSWQLMVAAKSIKAVDFPIHIYYALRSGSVINSLGANFFQKRLLLEQAQFEWLQKEDLLPSYMEKRFNNFFRDWLLQKLSVCREEEKVRCNEILHDIFAMYEEFYNRKDSTLNDWLADKI
ncbi:MAG: glycosyltransferase [Turicibacter sp.]|nr:glycosyltransferase [Turicibacter sp.]